MVISTFVQKLTALSLFKKGDEPVRVEEFNMTGNDLFVNSNAVRINADTYHVAGNGTSSLTNVQVQQIKDRNSLSIQSSLVNFSTDLNDLFDNKLLLNYVHATAPSIRLIKWDTATVTNDTASEQLPVSIKSLIATEPEIKITTHSNDSVTMINIPKSRNSVVKASGIYYVERGHADWSFTYKYNRCYLCKTDR